MNHQTSLHRLRTELFDICIIGGGASGAGCALDAAARGLNTALIEMDDFGAVTSGTSTKLVHGGVRYLEQAFKKFDPKQLSLVRKALHERKTLLQIAPHLAHPLALLTPCFTWFEGAYFTIGLKLYDLLAGNRQLEPSRWLNRAEAVREFPGFDGQKLHSAVMYYDGQFDDVRLNLALVQTAAQQGAAVANHIRAERFHTDETGRLQSVDVMDKLTGERITVRAKLFVNATGTRADFLRKDADKTRQSRMRASKGSHVILRADAISPTKAALLVPKTADGRVLFAIPWRGHWLIGTTDTEADPTDEPCLLPDEANYLTQHVSHYLTTPLSMDQVTGGFAGLRPLLQADPQASSKSLVRDHEVEIDPTSGLVSLMGGKWTTYRLMAQETIDACCRTLNVDTASPTETLLLAGGEGYTKTFAEQFRTANKLLPADIVAHLLNTYGTNANAIIQLFRREPTFSERLVSGHPFTKAEVAYAVRQEMALTIPDVLMRRIRLGLVDWAATLEALPHVADIMSRELNWSDADAHRAEAQFGDHIGMLMERAGLAVESTTKKGVVD
ncbi:MAG: FAD-dependent oxidoreductase [Bacteroidetes bacterium]|nr:FAD-dependent oxidoreductase [Fibrella sp.]